MGDSIRLLLVDDHFLMRAGLVSVFDIESDMTVCGEADTGGEAIELHRRLSPDVTLMDLRLPDMTGVAVTRAIRQESPRARIAILTNYGGDEEIYNALQAGAAAYLLKTVRRQELVSAIRQVAAGQTYVSPEIAARLVRRLPRSELSAREREVLMLVARGRKNAQIAEQLAISEATVKHHVSHILSKLGVADRAEAISTAIERGFLRLE